MQRIPGWLSRHDDYELNDWRIGDRLPAEATVAANMPTIQWQKRCKTDTLSLTNIYRRGDDVVFKHGENLQKM